MSHFASPCAGVRGDVFGEVAAAFEFWEDPEDHEQPRLASGIRLTRDGQLGHNGLLDSMVEGVDDLIALHDGAGGVAISGVEYLSGPSDGFMDEGEDLEDLRVERVDVATSLQGVGSGHAGELGHRFTSAWDSARLGHVCTGWILG